MANLVPDWAAVNRHLTSKPEVKVPCPACNHPTTRYQGFARLAQWYQCADGCGHTFCR